MKLIVKVAASVHVSVPVDLKPVPKVITGLPEPPPATIKVITCPGRWLLMLTVVVAVTFTANTLLSEASIAVAPVAVTAVEVEPESTLPTMRSLIVVKAVFVVGKKALDILLRFG